MADTPSEFWLGTWWSDSCVCVCRYEALAQLLCAFALLGGVYGLSKWVEATFPHPAVRQTRAAA